MIPSRRALSSEPPRALQRDDTHLRPLRVELTKPALRYASSPRNLEIIFTLCKKEMRKVQLLSSQPDGLYYMPHRIRPKYVYARRQKMSRY